MLATLVDLTPHFFESGFQKRQAALQFLGDGGHDRLAGTTALADTLWRGGDVDRCTRGATREDATVVVLNTVRGLGVEDLPLASGARGVALDATG